MKNNEKDYYEQIKNWDFSKFNIVSEKLTDWDMYEKLKEFTNENSKVLDLGTGGGEKVLECFPEVSEVLGTDFSKEMIKTAKKNLTSSGRNNISFRVMDNLNMDVADNYYDVVTARNTVTSPAQIYKALKKGGYLIIRGVDKYDCFELKRIFKKGQAVNDTKPISIIDYEGVLDAGFNDVELVPIHVREYFATKESLLSFLLKVPIIDDFSEEDVDSKNYQDKEIDKEKLDEYIKRNTYAKGIRLIRRYYGITARK